MSGTSIYFRARDETDKEVVIELLQSDWDRLSRRHDPVTSLEEIAVGGRWVTFGAARMWRVELSGLT